MLQADYVIVGSGLTGSTIARMLADHNQDVLLLERKHHIAGNVFDYRHELGLLIHHYGPHYFRCNSAKIWTFLNRFTSFYEWSATVKAKLNEDFHSWPINQSHVDALGPTGWHYFSGEPNNFEEACLAKIPSPLYQTFIKGYTEKQWNIKATDLNKELASRITINQANEDTLTPNARWNALPMNGYTDMVRKMIDGIKIRLNFDYLTHKDSVKANKLLVFTGPIDEFFQYKHGKLTYRGQRRQTEYFPQVHQLQPCVQVNYPDPHDPRIRTIEWKHLLRADRRAGLPGSVVTHETPFTPTNPEDYEYPFPDQRNKALYQRYRSEANQLTNTLICGRLGEYRYYDMDQAIGRAMSIAAKLIGKPQSRTTM